MPHTDVPDEARQPSRDGRPPFRYRALARVDRVIDGDSWTGQHKPDPQVTVEKADGVRYRLSGVDTRELRSADPAERSAARRDRRFMVDWVRDGRRGHDGRWPFVIEYGSDEYEGSFGRLLVVLIRKRDGAVLNDDLVAAFGDAVRADW